MSLTVEPKRLIRCRTPGRQLGSDTDAENRKAGGSTPITPPRLAAPCRPAPLGAGVIARRGLTDQGRLQDHVPGTGRYIGMDLTNNITTFGSADGRLMAADFTLCSGETSRCDTRSCESRIRPATRKCVASRRD